MMLIFYDFAFFAYREDRERKKEVGAQGEKK